MAKKDTIAALVKRGVSEEAAALILTRYTTLGSIASAGAPALAELGIEEAEAEDIIMKIGKRPARASSPSKKARPEAAQPEAVREPPEEIYRPHEYTDMEKRLFAIADRLGIKLPMKIVCDIAKRVSGADLPEETCEKLITVAHRMYTSHLMDQNESAGVMAAHSLGEPATQMNLRTFHFAGVANVNVTEGLPRIIEIVDARREPSTPSMTIPLKGLAAEDEGVAKHVASEIEITSLIDVASIETDITNQKLIVVPDARKMEERGLTIDDIVEKLNKIKAVRGMVTRQDYDIVIGSDEPSFKKLQQMYDAVRNAKLKGVEGIQRAILQMNKATGKWEIVTEGSNLEEVLQLESVEAENVMTNSVLEVADVLGIEAARNSIIHEAMTTMEHAGLDVDVRHVMLVADVMTNDGTVRAIGRHGVSGKKSSVLARAAFEITAAHLLHAATVGEVDHLEGVTENIIVGQPVTLGTGAVKLIYTPKKKKGENE